MNKTALSFFTILWLISTVFLMGLSPNIQTVKATLPVHNIDTHEDFATIQEAIDDSNTLGGHTVHADAGTYYEEVIVSKSILLIGEDKDTTVIDGQNQAYNVVSITANSAEFRQFTVRGGKSHASEPYDGAGIRVESSHSIITDNTISNCENGMWLENSSNNIIARNSIEENERHGINLKDSGSNIITESYVGGNNRDGVSFDGSSGNTVSNNAIHSNNDNGVHLYYSGSNFILDNDIRGSGNDGIHIYAYSGNNIVINNVVSGNSHGIDLVGSSWGGSGNVIFGNTISSNDIAIYHGSDNWIFHNNILYNVPSEDRGNILNNGYGEGNYWSDYTGVDVDGDGIGDTELPHHRDDYPLVSQIHMFVVPWEEEVYHVSVLTDSTISHFDFSQSQKQITFDLTGSGTSYCRVAIPTVLLDGEFTVKVGGDEAQCIPIKAQVPLSYSYLYFNCTLSTKQVIIEGTTVIPEFPSFLMLPLFIIATLIAVIVYRRNKRI